MIVRIKEKKNGTPEMISTKYGLHVAASVCVSQYLLIYKLPTIRTCPEKQHTHIKLHANPCKQN